MMINFFAHPTQLILLDFGASREFPKTFVDNYIRVIRAAARKDKEQVLKISKELGFLTGYETKVSTAADIIRMLSPHLLQRNAHFQTTPPKFVPHCHYWYFWLSLYVQFVCVCVCVLIRSRACDFFIFLFWGCC